MYLFDTETCGFHGVCVLIQHAQGVNGAVERHNVWLEPAVDTLALIEDMCDKGVVGFNLAFDWFHLQKLYNMLALLVERYGGNVLPIDHIEDMAMLEPKARDGLCIRPRHALDLMLHARKGPYQSTMDRKDIRIKRVPIKLGYLLADELNKRIVLKDIYFARQADKSKRWTVVPIRGDSDFVNVDLKFKPSSALKSLVVDALGVKEDVVLKFGEIGVDKRFRPVEVGWAPFALAISTPEKQWRAEVKSKGAKKKGKAWPGVVRHHISHWAYDPKAIKYSIDDVVYLQQLMPYFGNPEPDDDDSILATMVGSVRWRGYSVDMEKLRELHTKALVREKAAPKHPAHVRQYLTEVMDPIEQEVIKESTKKSTLETISKLLTDCPKCKAQGCPDCDNGAIRHPAAIRAEQCLDARKARVDKTLFAKLMQAERFHVSAKVIGSLSSRMTSGDGMNALGIQHLKDIRKAFTLAFGGLELCGGDFSAYEVSIADADYDDEELRSQLLTCYVCQKQRTVAQFDDLHCPHCGRAETKCKNCKKVCYTFPDGHAECECGKPDPRDGAEPTLRKLHGLFGQALAPGLSYEEILATKGSENDLYDQGKRGGFSQFYGGTWQTLVNRLGVTEEVAKQAEFGFANRFKGVARAKDRNYESFCSMRQPGGIGKEVFWNEPKDYAESLNGFRRYFTLENKICRELFLLANDPPKDWKHIGGFCVRRDRTQKVSGAVKSAIFAAAFQIQAKNMRAAQNHRIQATGAIETKRLQVRLWRLQPVGAKKWRIQPFNVHDELMTPVLPELKGEVLQTVKDFVLERRSLIPLLKMDFVANMRTWADKG